MAITIRAITRNTTGNSKLHAQMDKHLTEFIKIAALQHLKETKQITSTELYFDIFTMVTDLDHINKNERVVIEQKDEDNTLRRTFDVNLDDLNL